MKVIIVDTYYAAFLARLYAKHRDLNSADYETQLESLVDSCFGTSDFYSRNLKSLGCDASDLVVNCRPLQIAWAKERDMGISRLAVRMPHRFFRLPIVGRFVANLPGLMAIAVEQIKAAQPDILYCQDLSFFPGDVLKELKQYVRLVVGQIACPLPPKSFLSGYDLILTSFPHFVPRLRELGVASEYFRIGFDERVLQKLGAVDKDIDFSFVGGISRHHGGAIPLLDYLAKHNELRIFGYGVDALPKHSWARRRHCGEVWGMDMYLSLARSRITLNRHINVAENYANNMRLYEATGVGAMLITEKKDNLHELFEAGREVVTYSSKEEAAELVRYYLQHPAEAEKIAKAGQARTLRDHTYKQRMKELVPILERHLASR